MGAEVYFFDEEGKTFGKIGYDLNEATVEIINRRIIEEVIRGNSNRLPAWLDIDMLNNFIRSKDLGGKSVQICSFNLEEIEPMLKNFSLEKKSLLRAFKKSEIVDLFLKNGLEKYLI